MNTNEIRVRVVKRTGRIYLQLEWRNPTTGKVQAKSSGKTTAREAHKVAGELERQLRDGTHGRDFTPWAEFRERYLDEAFVGRAESLFQ